MVADPEIILLRLNKLEQCVKKLSELAGSSEDVFKHDEAVLDRVERNLQVAIQACIDIGSHIISSEGMKIPPNYKETFTVLQDRGIIPPDLAEKMKQMTVELLPVEFFNSLKGTLAPSESGDGSADSLFSDRHTWEGKGVDPPPQPSPRWREGVLINTSGRGFIKWPCRKE